MTYAGPCQCTGSYGRRPWSRQLGNGKVELWCPGCNRRTGPQHNIRAAVDVWNQKYGEKDDGKSKTKK